jgi:type VI secretion system protein ImpJ
MDTSKIVWTEGLFLRPQHFQFQDAYHERRLTSAMRDLHSFPWGLRHMVVAHADREVDRMELISIEAILPGGDPLRAPSVDELPPSLLFGHIAPDADTLLVGITLPAWRHEGGNCPDANRTDTRYIPRETQVPDLFADAAKTPVHFARLQPRLAFVTAENPDADVLPVARFRRGPGGRFRRDENFITPSVAIRDCQALHGRLGRLLDVLYGKIATLTAEQSEPVRDSVAFRAGDHATFWLLHTLGAGAAALGHLRELPTVAPERLFQEMLRIAGGLLAFRRTTEHRQLPVYDHMHSDACFSVLFDLVGDLVDTVIPTRFVVISLRQERPSYFVGSLDAEQLGDHPMLYLTVAAASADHDLVVTVPRRFKIGAANDVEKAVTSALPCVPLKHVPHPPPAVPLKPDHLYFVLDSKAATCKRMLEDRAVTVFVPGGLDALQLELLVINN